MSTSHPTPTGLTVTDEGHDFTRFARRIAAVVSGRIEAAGIDGAAVADALGVNEDEAAALLGGAGPGLTVAHLGALGALVGARPSALIAAAELVTDEGPNFVRFALPGWLTPDEVAEIRHEVEALVRRRSVAAITGELEPVEVEAVSPPSDEATHGDWGNLVYSDYDDEPAPREYVTRNECIQREIVEALGEYAAEHDVSAIADEVVESVGTGTTLRFRAVTGGDFWEVVQRHAIA